MGMVFPTAMIMFMNILLLPFALSRRILHQPLFPSASSPLPTPPPPAPPPTPTKEFAISISVGMVTLGMLSALAFYIYKHKVRSPLQPSPMLPASLPDPPPPPPPPLGIQIGQFPQLKSILPATPESVTPRAPPPPPAQQSESEFRTPESNAKLKPLHWDKVRATSDRATVWDHLKSNSISFPLNEDMMESLFGCNSRRSVLPPVEQDNRVLGSKKSQNIAIFLKALNVTPDEVSDALLTGNPEAFGAELLETLVKMPPTKEEETKLIDYNDDSTKLGSAEKFLKAILDIPFAFRRVESLQYQASFEDEVKYLRESFDTLEAASGELKSSRLFLKLHEAVLRTGNRGDANAFKLDMLLKLVDIKGADGKTTQLHFVVQEIIRSEGTRENEFQTVSGLSREVGSVKLAAGMNSDVLHGYVSKLETGLDRVRAALRLERPEMQGGFFESMKAFVGKAEEEISRIKDDEWKALSLGRDLSEYFHDNAGRSTPFPDLCDCEGFPVDSRSRVQGCW